LGRDPGVVPFGFEGHADLRVGRLGGKLDGAPGLHDAPAGLELARLAGDVAPPRGVAAAHARLDLGSSAADHRAVLGGVEPGRVDAVGARGNQLSYLDSLRSHLSICFYLMSYS